MIGANLGHFPEWATVLPEKDWQPLLNIAAPFGVLRFHDWQQINRTRPEQTPQVNPADLPKATDDWWFRGGAWHTWRGVPIEVCVDVANAAGARAWICIPHLATNDTIEHIVNLVIGRAQRRPIFEFSNEIWNGIFLQQADCAERGKWLDHRPLHAALQYQALRTRAIAWYVAGRGDVVISSHTRNPWFSRELLNLTRNHVTALAIAPYFGQPNPRYGYNFGPTSAHALRDGRSYIELILKPDIEQQAAIAAAAGVKLWAYEAGQHLRADGSAALRERYAAINRGQHLAMLYYYLYDVWEKAGGDLMCLYSLASTYERDEFWGLYEIAGGQLLTRPKGLSAVDRNARGKQ